MNRETEKWTRLARTPKTRDRIRRWVRRERIATGVMIASLIAVCAWPVAAVAHLVWTLVRGEDQPYAPWGWTFLGLLVFVALAALVGGAVRSKREEAVYAGGRVTLGRVVEVITHPSDVHGDTTYSLMVSAESPGSVTMRREIRMEHEWRAPEKWEGGTVRFRHNTLDPDELQDVLFIEFLDQTVQRREEGRP
ncbi:hypothetical protein [Nocardiopsis alba]|uniref:DUF3592 domain-containing protein n=1 Tax=Nocardiopsis alba (strain ATCC BAA-2165 / BE74) TaxID=1205910 RepID=J7KY50_NOCAA|nr:hypothetical protein [Nocardiopsis alba]AFR06328.1 hypothetical protein B005_4939 [Nocardiopsis alba ATCC BAA-2165]